MILVEHTGYFNLDHPEYYSDLFFLHRPSLAHKSIVTFDNPKAPLTKEMSQQLHEQGIMPVCLDFRAMRTLKTHTLIRWPKMKGRLNVANTDLRHIYDFWKKLFKRFGVTVYVGWHRYDMRHWAIHKAIQDVGGKMVIYQRSLNPDAQRQYPMTTDVAVIWGDSARLVEQDCGSTVGRYRITGYLGDFRFPLLRERAAALRSSTKFTIAYLDQNSVGEGNELQRKHYSFILTRILENPTLRLILKPKAPNTLRARLGPVWDLLQLAVDRGRCVMMADKGILSGQPPAAAALASDLVIHGHACAATAGLEARLAGVPTVFLNAEHAACGVMEQTDAVYPSWDVLWPKIEAREPWLGKWYPGSLTRFDPYRDGRARERFADLLEELL